jgi:hypothetical protein
MRWALIGWLLAWGATAASAADFLVESKVILNPKEAVNSTTVFQGAVTYDFLTSPAEITVFDAPHKRFVILDLDRRVKVELGTDEIDAFNQRLKSNAQERNVPLLSFLAEPTFDERWDEAAGELTMSSNWMSYLVKTTEAKQEDAVSRYSAYSAWQAKLNTVIRPGSFPPFARLLLNAALEKHDRLPVEVELTRYAQNPIKRQLTIRAQHRWQWRLLDRDLKRVEEANNHLVTFEAVSLPEYLKRAVQQEANSSAQAPAAAEDGEKR